MSLPEVQMLWVRGALSNLERLSIVSHLKNGHPVRLFSYEPIANLPTGTTWEDARAIVPEADVFAHRHGGGSGSLSPFSNFFRYKLIHERGGIWSDCDSICLKPLLFAQEMPQFFGSHRVPRHENDGGKVSAEVISGVFQAPAGSPIVARALEIAGGTDFSAAPWAATGPRAMTQAVVELGANDAILAPDVLCPYAWWEVAELIAPGVRLLPDNTHAVHFYNEVWRRNFLDKNAHYDPLCLYERLKAHYLDD